MAPLGPRPGLALGLVLGVRLLLGLVIGPQATIERRTKHYEGIEFLSTAGLEQSIYGVDVRAILDGRQYLLRIPLEFGEKGAAADQAQ